MMLIPPQLDDDKYALFMMDDEMSGVSAACARPDCVQTRAQGTHGMGGCASA